MQEGEQDARSPREIDKIYFRDGASAGIGRTVGRACGIIAALYLGGIVAPLNDDIFESDVFDGRGSVR